MKALILNSGLGHRMGVLTCEHPKCMTEISHKNTILSRQLRQIAEYLLVHETMEADEFNYFFENGQFMPEHVKAAKNVKLDKTIERPARKISMVDGYAKPEETGEDKSEEENK